MRYHTWGNKMENVRTRLGCSAYHMRRWLRLLRCSQSSLSYPWPKSMLHPGGIDHNSNWTNVCDGNIHQAVYQGLMILFAKSKVTDVVSHDFLLMGNSCLWGGLNCGTCRFPHPPGNILYSNAAFSTLYSIRATQRFGLSFLAWDSDGLGVIMSGK